MGVNPGGFPASLHVFLIVILCPSELSLVELHLLEFALFVAVDLLKDPVDLIRRGAHIGDTDVVVDKVNDHRGKLAHVSGLKPHSARQFRGLIGEVGGW